MKLTNVKCEYRVAPIGVGTRKPRFYWQLEAAEDRDVTQTSYRIRVTTDASSSAPVWDSGEVASSDSAHIEYAGELLQPRTRYRFQVTVRDNRGRSATAESTFETGLIDPDDWSAAWIGGSADEEAIDLLRTTFAAERGIAAARLYVTALGLYEVEINGTRAGDAYFAPGWTSYNKRLQTQTIDVTGLVKSGDNAIGVMLANGWYKGALAWKNRTNLYGDRRGLLLELHIRYDDGSETAVRSGEGWKSSTGPIRYAELYHGETYDARLEQRGWSEPGFGDAAWQPAPLLAHGKEMLVPQENEPVRIVDRIAPVGLIRTPRGETVIDFGQNMVGWVSFAADAPAGTEITLQHAEVLDRDGNFYTENLRSAKQTVRYICRGGGESYHPRFTFQGFRYVKVEGYPGDIDLSRFTGEVLHTDLERTGRFECSEPLLNQLMHNILWGQKGNFLDVPTDCPQRDERLGWTGDAQVFIRTSSYLMNVAPFFAKWLHDLKADQFPAGKVPHVVPYVEEGGDSSAAWGDAAVICPWTLYRCYGDRRVLAEQYESMKAWVEYIRAQGDNPYLWNTGFHFGDWLALDAQENSYIGATPRDLIATAFYAYSSGLLSQAAAALDYGEEARVYADLHRRVVEQFRREFVTPNGRIASRTQTAHVLALHFGLVPEEHRPRAAADLAKLIEENGHKLTTGFVGTPYLCHVLSQNGYTDLAYKLLLQEQYPSWLFSVKQGATTIWEHWDGIKADGSFWSADMNSYNHYAYGAVGDWMYGVMAGIDLDERETGYRRFRIAPQPGGGIRYVDASYESLYGTIGSQWTLEGDGTMRLEVRIPANTSAQVTLPGAQLDEVAESGAALASAAGVHGSEQQPHGVQLTLASGHYRFAYPVASNAKPQG